MIWLLFVHLVVTCSLVGLIWMVQLVHYPLMAVVGAANSVPYQQQHVQRIGWIVVPLMVVELITVLAICRFSGHLAAPWLAWAGVFVLGWIWITTALFSVPAHSVLQSGFQAAAHRTLVQTNWLRTIGWSVRAGIAVAMTSGLVGM